MFDLTEEEARLLLNVALMATGRNRFKSAARILSVLDLFRPNQVAVANAKAIALISAQKFQETVDYIDGEALVRFPDSGMLQAFKGMALLRMGLVEAAHAPLEAAATQEKDPAAAKLASDMLKGA